MSDSEDVLALEDPDQLPEEECVVPSSLKEELSSLKSIKIIIIQKTITYIARFLLNFKITEKRNIN